MLFYIFVFAVSILLAWIGMQSVSYEKYKYLVALISSMPLFLVSAFRYGIGTDYFTYLEIFEKYASKGYRAGLEPIYYALNRVVGLLGINPQVIFVIGALVYVGFVFTSIFRDSDNPVFSIFLLFGMIFYFSSMNLMRQHMACAILLFSLKYVKEQKFIKFLLLVLIATGIHYISLVFLVVYFLYNIKLKQSNAIALIVIVSLLSGFIIRMVSVIASSTKYAMYFTGETGFTIQTILGILVQLAIFGVATVYYKDDARFNLYYWLQTIAVIITILGGFFSIITRVKWLFALPSVILLPMVVNNCENKRAQSVIYLTTLISFFAYAVVIVGFMGSQDVVPYTSVFFDR